MLNLVWKDLMILNRYLLLALLYVIFALFVFRIMPNGALSAAAVGTTYILMIQAIILDDKNKSEIMLNSLPLRRKDIVLAKYLSVFLYTAIAILFFLFAQGVVSVTGIPIPTSRISIEGISGALLAVVILTAIYFPIYFKFGYLRSRMVGMILFFSCFFFVPQAVFLAVNGLEEGNPVLLNIVAIMQKVVGWLQSQADWLLAGYLLALALMIMAVSACLSLRFYSRREF